MKYLLAPTFVLVLAACAPSTPSPAAQAPPSTKSGRSAEEIYSLRERCGKNAAEWFKANFSEQVESLPAQSGGGIDALPATYENHYSEQLNRCYAVVYQMTSIAYGRKPTPRHRIVQSNTLYDVHENSQIGIFIVADLENVTACNVAGAKCTTKDEFIELAKPYMLN